MAPALRLRKWYLDAVSDDGACVIAYWARLEWGAVALSYGAVLDARTASPVTRTHWLSAPEPAASEGRVTWAHEGLSVRGVWTPATPPVERTLFETQEGAVRWSCVQPAGEAEIDLDGDVLRGRGYAERLEMTLPPWRLPIAELRWGRAITRGATGEGPGAAHGVTWIDWRGAHPLSLVLDGSREAASPRVGDERVSADGVEVSLSEGRTLRDGPLVTGALRGAPGIARWAPVSILSAHEHKRLSPATVTTGGVARDAWAIHEVVRFDAANQRKDCG